MLHTLYGYTHPRDVDPFRVYATLKTDEEMHEVINSPEYCFYVHYYHLTNAIANHDDESPIKVQYYIQMLADCIAKSLVFRPMGVPVPVWVLLEPKGMLGRHFEKVIGRQLRNNDEDIDKFIELYNKCEVKPIDNRGSVDEVLRTNIRDSYEALKELWQLYLSLAGQESIDAMATTFKINNQLHMTQVKFPQPVDVDSNSDGIYDYMQFFEEFDGTPEEALSVLQSLEFPEIDYDEFYVSDNYFNYTVRYGSLVNLGINAVEYSQIVQAMLKICEITSELQKSYALDIKDMFLKTVSAADLVFRFRLRYEELDISLDEFSELKYFETKEVKDTYQYKPEMCDNIGSALDVLNNIESLSEDDVWYGLAKLTEAMFDEYRDIVSEYDYPEEFVKDLYTHTDSFPADAIDAALNGDANIGDIYMPDYQVIPSKAALDWVNSLT